MHRSVKKTSITHFLREDGLYVAHKRKVRRPLEWWAVMINSMKALCVCANGERAEDGEGYRRSPEARRNLSLQKELVLKLLFLQPALSRTETEVRRWESFYC